MTKQKKQMMFVNLEMIRRYKAVDTVDINFDKQSSDIKNFNIDK